MFFKYFLLISSLVFPQYNSIEWDSITSLLSPTGIKFSDSNLVYASTPGGLLEYNSMTDQFNFIKHEHGLVYLDLKSIELDHKGRIWLGGAYPNGFLQVFDPGNGIVRKITHLDEVKEITKIQIGANYAFAIYLGETINDFGVLRFDLDNNDLPIYKDYYVHFPSTLINKILDIDLYADSLLYLTTDQGIYVGDINKNLKFSDNWNNVYIGSDAKQFIIEDIPVAILDNSILFLDEELENLNCPIEIDKEIIDAKIYDNILHFITSDAYYQINNCNINRFDIPFGKRSEDSNNNINEYGTYFTSFDIRNTEIYIGVKHNGILKLDNSLNYSVVTPHTTFSNTFNTITFFNDNIAAASSYGLSIINSNINNFLPHKIYAYHKGASGNFYKKNMNYDYGDHEPVSIVDNLNTHLVVPNSGFLPGMRGGAIIEINIDSGSINTFDNSDGIIDGFWGKYLPGVFSEYMIINQIKKDNDDNIWIVNPFCEKNGHLIAMKSGIDGSWSHIKIPDSTSFRPQSIDFDKYSNVWISFAYETIEDGTYSAGGIKVFNLNDSVWIDVENLDKLPANDPNASIWSIVFDKMNFLWILGDRGIRVLDFSYNNEKIKLDPVLQSIDGSAIDYLTDISFVKGNRIKVDSQNNKWIITHKGIWVIQESLSFWPSDEGLNMTNSDLLSDIVYDITFDSNNGLAYIATDKGISILNIPFSNDPGRYETLYITPNPFIISDHEKVIIKNFPSGSRIKIMTISGKLVKDVQMPGNYSQFLWDGTDNKGNIVGTAVYLVAAYHPIEKNIVSKIAVIR